MLEKISWTQKDKCYLLSHLCTIKNLNSEEVQCDCQCLGHRETKSGQRVHFSQKGNINSGCVWYNTMNVVKENILHT